MLLYDTHGWIHLSIGRPERWFFWGLIEFICTASLFLLMLRWGPSGIALAWTASFYLLMFPGFWYAGKPINLGIGSVLSVIWKFFLASALAGCATRWMVQSMIHFTATFGAPIALVRIVAVSALYFGLYLGLVIILHWGLKPIKDTIGLLRELLPGGSERSLSKVVQLDHSHATEG